MCYNYKGQIDITIKYNKFEKNKIKRVVNKTFEIHFCTHENVSSSGKLRTYFHIMGYNIHNHGQNG